MNCEMCGHSVINDLENCSYSCKDCNLIFMTHYEVFDLFIDKELIEQGIKIGDIISFYEYGGKDFLVEKFKKILKMKSFL